MSLVKAKPRVEKHFLSICEEANISGLYEGPTWSRVDVVAAGKKKKTDKRQKTPFSFHKQRRKGRHAAANICLCFCCWCAGRKAT